VFEYRTHHPGSSQTLAASHTIAVTIAAEQGVIGELAYLALAVVAAVGLLRGARSDPYRAAIAAAFLALVFHTLLYADFLEDPVTWTLLGVGVALAVAGRSAGAAPEAEAAREAAVVPA
jgi:O-antigen ligase